MHETRNACGSAIGTDFHMYMCVQIIVFDLEFGQAAESTGLPSLPLNLFSFCLRHQPNESVVALCKVDDFETRVLRFPCVPSCLQMIMGLATVEMTLNSKVEPP
jgi:hypothetical protein